MIHAMYPITARFGSIFIYSYTVVLILAILAGIGFTIWTNRESNKIDWFDAVLVILIGAILGGRIGFVILRWDYFQDRIPEAWQIWRGGLSYHPALLGGILALFLWALFKRRSFYQLTAILIPAFILIAAFGWAACWMEGCAYGKETVLGLLAADLPDDLGVFAVRYQSQVIGFGLSLLLFLVIIRIGRRVTTSSLFWFTLAAMSLVHFIVGLLRGDPAPGIWNLRLDLLVDGLLVIVAVILLQFEIFRNRSIAENKQK